MGVIPLSMLDHLYYADDLIKGSNAAGWMLINALDNRNSDFELVEEQKHCFKCRRQPLHLH